MLHVNFDGNYQVGEMIVNSQVADQVINIFEELCEARYEIYSMYLIDDFWGGQQGLTRTPIPSTTTTRVLLLPRGEQASTPHVITEEDYAYQLFTANGWTWGGAWSNPKDYQHFQYG